MSRRREREALAAQRAAIKQSSSRSFGGVGTRALTAADIVTVNNLLNPHPISLSTLLNPHPVSLSTLLNPHPVSLASIPNPPNLDVALSTRATGTLLNPHPVSLSTLLNPHPVSLSSQPEKGFSTLADVATRGLVDAERHMQVDVLSGGGGLAAEPTFSVVAAAVAPALNKSMISILNVDAALKVKIHEIWISNQQVTAVTGVVHDMRLFRMTGHSVGTSLTPVSYDLNDSLSGNITVRTGGTIAGEFASPLDKWSIQGDELKTTTLDAPTMETIMANRFPLWMNFHDVEKCLTLRQNQGLTIKEITNTIVGTFDLVIVFTVA